MNSKSYYDVLDKFIVRIPLMPYNNYEKIWNEDYIKNIATKDEKFKEAVKISSSSMYRVIQQETFNNEVIKSLMKYTGRAMLRTVPFGTLCGVSIGNFGSDTRVKYDENSMRKRIRPDYTWISALIKKIEIECKGYRKFELYTNRVIEEYGNKIRNQIHTCFNCNKDINDKDKITYINKNVNTIFVLSFLKNGGNYKEICRIYKEKNINVNSEVLDMFIEHLIANEFIYTEVRPPFDECDVLSYIIEKIENRHMKVEFLIILKEINELIYQYNMIGKNCGTDLIEKIEKKMRSIVKTEVFIQVDSLNPFRIELNNCIKDDLITTCNLLTQFSSKQLNNKEIYEFKDEFAERYDEYKEIPILEAVKLLLGYEESYNTCNFIEENKKQTKKFNFLKEKICAAIINNTDVRITDNDFEKYENNNIDVEKLTNSMELYCSIHAEDISAFNSKNYFINIMPNVGNEQAGKSFGRFSDIDNNIEELLEEIKTKEKNLINDGYILCDLVCVNIDSRANNVSINKNINDFQLNLSPLSIDKSIKNIDIDDVYVGLENEKLYLKSKKYNKKLKLVINNMLNIDIYNKVAKLMIQISNESKSRVPIYFIDYIRDIDNPYIPRIMYKNIILSPRTWKFDKEFIISNKENTYDEFKKNLEQLNKIYKMPEILYYKDEDQILLVNLKIEKFKEILYKEFKKEDNKFLCFQEADLESKWIRNNENFYTGEFVFQFIKNKMKKNYMNDINNVLLTKSPCKNLISRNINGRVFNIFSEWMYLKIYNDSERTNELLGIDLRNLIINLENKGLINKWFFIRYKDSNNHIRLRLNIEDFKNNYSKVLNIIDEWEGNEKAKRLVSKIVIDEYKREIERYGGEEIIGLAENVFKAHSLSIIEFLYLKKSKKIKMTELEFAVCSIINFMELIGINYINQMKIFDSIVQISEMRKDFTKDRKRYISLCNSNNDWEELKKDKDGDVIYQLINIGKQFFIEYWNSIDEVDNRGDLVNYKVDILLSIVHMFCNRLLGITRDKERKVIVYTRHTLYALKYLKKLNKN